MNTRLLKIIGLGLWPLLFLSRYGGAAEEGVRVIERGGYLAAALGEIAGARESVDVFLYSFEVRADRAGAAATRLAEALREAHRRGVRVRVVLDQGPDPVDREAGFDRNGGARDFLAGAGVPVFEDDPGVVLHAKVLVVDGERVLTGSTNWTEAGLTQNVEMDVLVRSRRVARDVLEALGKTVPAAAAEAPVEAPASFLTEEGLLARMVTRGDERAFDAMLYLWKVGDEKPLDTAAMAAALGMGGMSREGYRRQILKTLGKLRDMYGLIGFEAERGGEPVVALKETSGPVVGIPLDYWRLGWDRRLSFPGRVFWLIGRHQSTTSADRPRWSRSGEALGGMYHVSPWFITQGVTALRRAGLVDVRYAELTKDGGPHGANVYLPRRFYDFAAVEKRFADLEERWGAAKVKRARALAALVYDDSDAAGAARLIALEERYGAGVVRRAEKILGDKHPANPLRNMGYLLGTVEKIGEEGADGTAEGY